jgi:hypothetical protein
MIFLALLFFSALFISSVAGYFSIVGLTAIFPGSVIPIVLMGVAFEIGKLMSASWLYRFWHKAHLLMRTYFLIAIFTLSFVTSIGIFGYLSRAHIEGTQGIGAGADQIEMVDNQIKREQQNIVMQETVLKQLDNSVNNLIADTSKTERAIRVRNSQRKERANITQSIDSSSRAILAFQQQKVGLSSSQRKLETDIGPIKYVSQLIFSSADTPTIEKAVRLLILLMITVFDPLAILLVVAANIQIREMRKVDSPKSDDTSPPIDPPTEEPPAEPTETPPEPAEIRPATTEYRVLHHPS